MFRQMLAYLCVVPAIASGQPGCDLSTMGWTRTGDPVLRDPIAGENYEVASDPHVFQDPSGKLHMIYSGDDQDHIAIKLATGADMGSWQTTTTLVGLSHGHDEPLNKETPFYNLTPSGEHQIYFIGYPEQETYEASVYLATAQNVEGPYTVLPEPVVKRGELAGKQVYLITSPSVVMHDGLLHMAFLGWNGFEDVTEVWSLGAVSDDNGRTWRDFVEISAPIGMEGQITPLPGGGFVATRTGEFGNTEGIGIACADHPFGPYSDASASVMQLAGPPWEVDEIIAPQITFDRETGKPNLFYTGANYATGWWIMRALPAE